MIIKLTSPLVQFSSRPLIISDERFQVPCFFMPFSEKPHSFKSFVISHSLTPSFTPRILFFVHDFCYNIQKGDEFMNENETNCSKEQLKLFLNNVALQSTNITLPEKCSCCPYMFEYKCRSEKCINEE